MRATVWSAGWCCLLTLVLAASPVRAQKVGTTSFQFLKVTQDARVAGMAGVGTSVSRTSGAVFFNPAGLTRISRFDVTASYVDWFVDTRLYAMAGAYTLGNLGTVAVYSQYADYGQIEVTEVASIDFNSDGTINPGLTGETIHPNIFVTGLSYARSVTDKLSFGLTAKYVREDLSRSTAATLAFDGGLLFDTGFRSIRIAAAVRHFGPEVTYVDRGFPLPQTFDIGISGYIVGSNALVMPSSDYTLLASYSMINPRDFGQQHKVGLEVSMLETLALRGGYRFNFDDQGVTFGTGLTISRMRFDYAYDPFGRVLDAVHRLSIGYSIR